MNKQNGDRSVIEMDYFSEELMKELSKRTARIREKGEGVTVHEFMEYNKMTGYTKAKKILESDDTLVSVKMRWEGTFRPSIVYIKKEDDDI